MSAGDSTTTSEARFRAIFESIDEGYCLCEMVTDADGVAIDYRFLEANQHFAGMTGLEDAVGRTALEMLPDLEREWVDTYAKVGLGGETLRFSQGSEVMGRWFDVFAMPVPPHGRFALVFKDVTLRHRAELQAAAREADERRGRLRAELLVELGYELEAASDPTSRAERLAELLVPLLGDLAAVDAPGLQAPASAAIQALDPTRQIAATLELGADETGTLRTGITDPERGTYDAEDVKFLEDVAARMGVVFVRAQLREEEHQIAIRLQDTLLPDPVLRRPGIELAARYAAASELLEVGGDWFDAFDLPDGRVGITVGDVVGHGVEAAAKMGRTRTAIAALARHSTGPGDLLSRYDDFAIRQVDSAFTTACVAFVDPATGALEHASAGHPPVLVVAPDGAAGWLEGGRSAPLYGDIRPERPSEALTLAPGALLVLFSDGLVERRREPLDVSLDRFAERVVAARTLPPAELCEHLIAVMGLDEHRDDDVVVVCARIADRDGPDFHRVFPAAAAELRPMREAVRVWLGDRHVGEQDQQDVLSAIGEASTNAIEHAYRGRPDGSVELCMGLDDATRDLRVRVMDFGSWNPHPRRAGTGGYGTGIMRSLTHSFTRHSDSQGTVVDFVLALRPEATA